jgi:hypothetical protein
MTNTELIEFKKKIELIIEILKYDMRNADPNGTPVRLNQNNIWYKKEAEQMIIKAEELGFWLDKAISKTNN